MNNKIKSQLQQRAFEDLKSNYRVILKWATGCGKSKMAIDLVKHAMSTLAASEPPRILFVVAERAHIKNWKAEFKKWDFEAPKGSIDIMCYASLHKAASKYDIVVLDECHHAFTEKRLEHLRNIDTSYVYLLSATLSKANEDIIDEIYGKFATSTVTLKEAVEKDILSEPRVYIIGIDLDNTNANQLIQIGSGDNLPIVKWDDRAKYIYKNTPCRIKCTQRQKYAYMTTTMDYWKNRFEHSHNNFFCNKWVNMGSQRKRFLGDVKTPYIKEFIENMPDNKRFVCFCSSVDQATGLCAENTISSRRSSKMNQTIIDAFNNKKINQLYAVGMITEGMNLTDIHAGIIVQLDGKERLFVQKFGRSMRAQDPVSYIFYCKDTQDETYLKTALENIDEQYIKYLDINQLNTVRL